MSYHIGAKVILKNEMHVIQKLLQVGFFSFSHQWSCFTLANALGVRLLKIRNSQGNGPLF
jgi:hypothetical protein